MDWKKKAIIGVILALMPLSAMADITHIYVVRNELVPKLTDITSRGKTDSSNSLQNIIVQVLPGDTTYTLVQITLDQANKTIFDGLSQQGAVIEIAQDTLISEFQRGELVTTRTHKEINPLPRDIGKIYVATATVPVESILQGDTKP